MKRVVLGALLAAAVLVVQPMSAAAAPSATNDATVVGESAGSFVVGEVDTSALAGVADEEDVQLLEDLKAQTVAPADFAARVPELKEQMTNKMWLTGLFDLSPADGVQEVDGGYRVTLSVPTLAEDAPNVGVIHFNVSTGAWEYIIPDNVDFANKQLTVTFSDLSPVIIVAGEAAQQGGSSSGGSSSGSSSGGSSSGSSAGSTSGGVGTSPKTGVVSDWGMWIGAAAVLAAVAAVASKRSRA